jgi:putative sigma-54 modulation protein
MKVVIHGVHLTLTDEMKAYVEKRLVHSLERFYDNEAAELSVHLVDVNGPKGGEDKECRVTVFMPGSAPLHLSERSDDIFKSIDLVEDRLIKATKRELDKKRQGAGHPMQKPAAHMDHQAVTSTKYH